MKILVIAHEGKTADSELPEEVSVVQTETVELGPLSTLTPREIEVLALIGEGKSAKEIGEVLGCSHRTVERHRDAIGKKLQKHDRVELALIAQTAGLERRDAHAKRVDASSREPQGFTH